ncbi:hypothetical protein SAMN02910264_00914 [Ruminococcaceae bacterium YAD3003]|nr:hypothetical protein SAMN02910264_00914 [Ruminococcaceae bacterium YAD3003]
MDNSGNKKDIVIGFFKNGWANNVRLMAANVLFILFNIPSILLSYFLSSSFVFVFSRIFNWDSLLRNDDDVTSYWMYMLLIIFFINALVSSCLICIGPFQAGFSNLYKNIRNGSSVSLFSDFKSGLKNNVGKSIGAMIIGLLATFISLLAVSFYINFNKYLAMLFVILMFALVLIQNFVYQLIVSTDLSLFKIYKNAFLLLLIRFIPNIGVSLVVFVFYIAVPFYLLMSASYLTLGIFVFLYSFLCISWVQYFLNSYTRRLIERFVKESATENGAYSDDNDKINNVTSENTDS